jgi:hypothetical protein
MTTKRQSETPGKLTIPLDVPFSLTREQALAITLMIDELRDALWRFYLFKAGVDPSHLGFDDLPF